MSIFDKTCVEAFGLGDEELKKMIRAVVGDKRVGDLTKADVLRIKNAVANFDGIEEKLHHLRKQLGGTL